jgi:hypothetical protein
VALHGTEPTTIYLSCRARIDSLEVAEVDRALYDDRTLVKQLAMRRTLFAFPCDLLAAVWPSASARVAATERSRIVKGVEAAGLATDGQEWLDSARAEILSFLAPTPAGRSALEIRQAVPRIDVPVALAAGSTRASTAVLTQLGATADIVRAANVGHWRASRPLWTLRAHWLPDQREQTTAETGYRTLVSRWLRQFGPGSVEDLTWWLGATKTIVRRALLELDTVAVQLDDGTTGWLLPDDLDEVAEPDPWVALLPVLDPTVMGWRSRTFYLGHHSDQLFDRQGNAATTAWVEGNVVGCWVQDSTGTVRVRLLEPVSVIARRRLAAEAANMTEWLAGVRAGSVAAPAVVQRDI